MDYESFKVQLSAVLSTILQDVSIVMDRIDAIAQGYEIRKKETAISVYQSDIPEALMLFLAAKGVEEKSKSTLKLYRSVLSGFFRSMHKPIGSISTNDVRVYLFHCRSNRHHAAVTVGNTRRILNGFFEWCVMEQIVQMNPVKRIAAIKPDPSPRHAMQRTELEYLRNACTSLRDKALVDFLFSTGARVSEVSNARITDINWEKKSVQIVHGKGNKSRTTYLNPEAEVSLRAYLDSRQDASPYIFARVRGKSDKPLSPKAIQEAIDRIVANAHREFSVHITPHIFRHTVATIALRNGMALEQVQHFLGHAKPETTLIYAEVSDDDVRHSHSRYVA